MAGGLGEQQMATSILVKVTTEDADPSPPAPPPLPRPPSAAGRVTRPLSHPLVLLNSAFILLGSGGPFLLRVYFVHGGRRLWLSSLLQICGWPLLVLPISLARLRLPRHHLLSPWPLAAAFAGLGLLYALVCYLYSLGANHLPLSTSSILISTQLAFTAAFALLLVRQRLTPFSLNAVVLLTLGPVVLGLGSSSDRPPGEDAAAYLIGFFFTLGSAALAGFVLPLMELATRRAGPAKLSYALVMEMQLVMGLFGTAFCLVGMAADGDFQAIPREARSFGLGEAKYYVVLVADAVFWQLLNMGLVGVISTASSLLAGIMVAVLLPLSEVLAIIFLHEKFSGGKGVALALSIWGFASYLYGERVQQGGAAKQTAEVQLATSSP